MATIVSIKQTSDKVSCDGSGSGSCKFFVTNAYNDRQLLVKARIVVESGADEKWFTAVQASGNHASSANGSISTEWKLAPSATEEISVSFQVPKTVADGKYGFHLQVFSVDRPDEDFKDGEPVYVEIKRAGGDPPPPPPFRWWILVVALVVLLTVAGVTWLLMSQPEPVPTEQAKIPDLKGLIWDEAQTRLKNAGFSKFETEYKFDPSKRDPIVLDQSPASGTAAQAEDSVKVVLSFPGIEVPNTKGKTFLAATQAIVGAGLTINAPTQQATDAQPEQTVLDQTPAAGQMVDKNTGITLTVATKPGIRFQIDPRVYEILRSKKMLIPRELEPAENPQ